MLVNVTKQDNYQHLTDMKVLLLLLPFVLAASAERAQVILPLYSL